MGVKCQNCGLVNWAEATNCVRCEVKIESDSSRQMIDRQPTQIYSPLASQKSTESNPQIKQLLRSPFIWFGIFSIIFVGLLLSVNIMRFHEKIFTLVEKSIIEKQCLLIIQSHGQINKNSPGMAILEELGLVEYASEEHIYSTGEKPQLSDKDAKYRNFINPEARSIRRDYFYLTEKGKNLEIPFKGFALAERELIKLESIDRENLFGSRATATFHWRFKPTELGKSFDDVKFPGRLPIFSSQHRFRGTALLEKQNGDWVVLKIDWPEDPVRSKDRIQ